MLGSSSTLHGAEYTEAVSSSEPDKDCVSSLVGGKHSDAFGVGLPAHTSIETAKHSNSVGWYVRTGERMVGGALRITRDI